MGGPIGGAPGIVESLGCCPPGGPIIMGGPIGGAPGIVESLGCCPPGGPIIIMDAAGGPLIICDSGAGFGGGIVASGPVVGPG